MNEFEMRRMLGRFRPGRPPAGRLEFFVLVALAVLIGIGLAGCGFSSDDAAPATTAASAPTTGGDPPLVDTVMVAPTVIDVPYARLSFKVTPEAGGATGYGDAVVLVPPGAVSEETTIDIKRLTFPFHSEELPESPPPDAAIGLGDVYDFGPTGLVFSEPVIITVPYDEGSLPEGFAEADVGLAYWNGAEWIVCAGQVNTADNTVSVQFERFDGIALETIAVVSLATLIVGEGIYLYHRLTDPERINSDAVKDGTASKWIVEGVADTEVQRRAAQAGILNIKTNEIKSLDAPDLGQWMADAANSKQVTTLVYQDPDKGVLHHVDDRGPGSNWQKPRDLFTKGTAVRAGKSGQLEGGPLHGDCTDITNAAVSVLRIKGFPAQAVYGRAKGTGNPHVWTEVRIGEQIYRIENNGDFASGVFDECDHFGRYEYVTDADDVFYNSTWNETGQRPYDADWWQALLTTTTTSTSQVIPATDDTEGVADTTAESTGDFPYVGIYEGTIKGLLSGGGESADVTWHFTVDGIGYVTGGWDVTWHEVRDVLTLNGRVSDTGEVTAEGTETLTSSSGTKSSGSIQLVGTISKGEFEGALEGSGGRIQVKATRQ